MSFLSLNNNRYLIIKIVIAAFLLYTTTNSACSQENNRDQNPPFRERLFFGGNLGLQFGTITYIDVTPLVGFWVQPRIAVALGPHYRYFRYPDYFSGTNTSTSLYGGNGYVEFYPVKDLDNVIPIGVHLGIFLHVEDEMLSLIPYDISGSGSKSRIISNAVLAGPGLSQMIGRRSSFNLTFLWTLNNTIQNLYNTPEIRVSFTF